MVCLILFRLLFVVSENIRRRVSKILLKVLNLLHLDRPLKVDLQVDYNLLLSALIAKSINSGCITMEETRCITGNSIHSPSERTTSPRRLSSTFPPSTQSFLPERPPKPTPPPRPRIPPAPPPTLPSRVEIRQHLSQHPQHPRKSVPFPENLSNKNLPRTLQLSQRCSPSLGPHHKI